MFTRFIERDCNEFKFCNYNSWNQHTALPEQTFKRIQNRLPQLEQVPQLTLCRFEYFHPVDAVLNPTIHLELFVRDPLQNAAISATFQHRVGVLAEIMAEFLEPSIKLCWVT